MLTNWVFGENRLSDLRFIFLFLLVFISAGEMLAVAEQFLEQQMHPTVIISAYRQALEDILETLKEIRYILTHLSVQPSHINKV